MDAENSTENYNDLSSFEVAPTEFSARGRKKLRSQSEAGELTITSLMDILTILLVFLLKSFSSNPVNISQSDKLQLPASSAQLEPEEAVPVAITADQILVNDKAVASLIDGRVDPAAKSDGEKGFLIDAVKDALSKEADNQKRIAKHNTAQEFKGLALIIAHEDTKYRTLNEVLYSAGQSQFSQFKFAVIKKE